VEQVAYDATAGGSSSTPLNDIAALQHIFPIIARAPALSAPSITRTVWRTVAGFGGGLIVRAKALKGQCCGPSGRCGRKFPIGHYNAAGPLGGDGAMVEDRRHLIAGMRHALRSRRRLCRRRSS